METNIEKQPLVYATFMQRVHALVIDSLIFFPVSYWSSYNLMYSKEIWVVVVVALIWWIYKPVMEWKLGATFGKKIAKIKVIGEDGKKPSFNQAMLRFTPYFAVGMSQLLFNYNLFNLKGFATASTLEELQVLQEQVPGTSVLVAVFFFAFSVSFVLSDERKQAFHDRYSQTLCVVES